MRNILTTAFLAIAFPTLVLAQFFSCNDNDCGTLDPSWQLVGSESKVCEGESFLLTAEESTPLNNIDSFRWIIYKGNFEILLDTTFGDLTQLEYLFEVEDEDIEGCDDPEIDFQVNLVVTSPACPEGISCRNSLEPLTVILKPRADFQVVEQVCENEIVNFNNTSCFATSYLWNFGDGETSTEIDPVHTYSSEGVFQVALTAYNQCGEDTQVMQVEVIGLPEANVAYTLNPATGCTNLVVTFDNLVVPYANYSAPLWEITPSEGWFYSDTIYSENSWENSIIFYEPGIYEIVLTVVNICGEDIWMETIEVFQAPTATLVSPGSECIETPGASVTIDFEDYLLNLTGSTCGFDWVITNTDNNEVFTSSDQFPVLSFDDPGEYEVELTIDGCNCGDIFESTVFYIQTPTSLTFDVPVGVICTNSDTFQIVPSVEGGMWSPQPLISVDGLFNPFEADIGSNVVEYSVGTGACESTGSVIINVLEAPSLDIQEVEPECDELNYTPDINYAGSFDGETWSLILESGSVQIYDPDNTPSILITETGVHYFVVELTGECDPVSDTIVIEIQSIEPIVILPPPTPVCSTSSPDTIEVSPLGGEWSGTGVSVDGVFDPSIPIPGTPVTLTYTFAEGVCSASESIQVVVIASQPVNVETDITLCTDSEPYTLSFDPLGGTWSGTGISVDGVFDPEGLVPGPYEVSYLFEDINDCEITQLSNITVEALPNIEMDNMITFCETDADIDLPSNLATFNLTPATGTITWNGPGIIDALNGIFNSLQAGATGVGNYTVYLNYMLVDCEVLDSLIIEVVEIQPADAGVDTLVCISDGTYSLIGLPSGGIWQELNGNGDGLNPNTGVIDLEMAEGGMHEYQYVFAAGTSCEVQDQVSIEIIDLTGVNAGSDFEICEGTPAFQLTGYSPPGGEWTGPGIITPEGFLDPSMLLPDSSYNLTYCITDATIVCSACDVINLTLNALPVADFQINGTNCIGEILDIENLSLGACEYFWDFGNGETSTDQIPEPIYNQTGSYIITLIAESCPGCFDTLDFPIVVTEPATASFAQDVSEGCAILDVTFANQSFGSDMSYFWDFGNGETSTDQFPNTISFEQGNTDTTYYIALVVTNGCGTVEYFDSVTVFPIPVVIFSPNVDDGCSPLPIDFSNISVGNPEYYAWYIDGIFISSDSILQNQIFTTYDTVITTYEISLIADNFCGSDTLSNEIIVYPPNVDAFLYADTTSGCQPLTVQFGNFSTPGAVISWDFGDGNGSFETDPVYTFDSAGVFTVFQYASNCGTDLDSVIIEVLPAPYVSFSHNPYVCDGQPITFINESIELSGSEWDFGDGGTSLLDNPTHVFDGPGDYIVTLTGYSNLNNCPAPFQSSVTVLGNPIVSFAPSVTDGCAPLSIDFLNTSIGAVYFEWDFGNNQQSIDENPQNQIFEIPGTYEVTLTGTDMFGCFSDTSIINIIVHEVPQAGFSTNDSEFCSGVDVIETTNTSQGASQYYWTFGNSPVIDEFEPSQIILDTGYLEVTLVAENGFGCLDTAIQELNILGTPQASIGINASEGCQPAMFNFDNNSNYSDNFEWSFGDGSINSTLPNLLYTYLDAGIYTLILTANNSNGCPSDSDTLEITVHPKPIADFELSDLLVCGLPDTIQSTNFSQGANDYLWNFGNGQTSISTNPAIIYQTPDDYTVSLIVTNSFGCRDTMEQIVSVNLQPLTGFEPSFYQGCEPDIVDFINTTVDANSWIWYFGDGTTSTELNPSHVYQEAGNYNIQLIASYNESCFDTISVENAVFILPSPIAAFTYTDMEDGKVQFTNQSTDASAYQWDFGNGDFSDQISPFYEYNDNGNWQVILTAIHINGCEDMDTMAVSPKIFFGFYVPNAMSPESGEGDVRLFKPVGIGITSYTIQIYSPWGQLLWENSELEGEQPKGSWDGTFKAEIVPQGAYVWKAKIEYINGIIQAKTGTVSVLR